MSKESEERAEVYGGKSTMISFFPAFILLYSSDRDIFVFVFTKMSSLFLI